MEDEGLIRGRRSIRSYLPDPLPERTIREVLDEARWAPSWRNTQAWHVRVLTGASLDRFKEQFTRRLLEDAPAGRAGETAPGDGDRSRRPAPATPVV